VQAIGADARALTAKEDLRYQRIVIMTDADYRRRAHRPPDHLLLTGRCRG